MSDEQYEKARARYKPEKVRVLFVGESRPNGGTFFYHGNSNLARYTQEAFERAVGLHYKDPADFLEDFRRRSFYLDDLCESPVNRVSRRARESIRKSYEGSLALRIKEHSPERIVCVMRGILPNVQRASLATGISMEHICSLRFPAMGHQRAYVDQLVGILSCLI
jgi:hypothetical protein